MLLLGCRSVNVLRFNNWVIVYMCFPVVSQEFCFNDELLPAYCSFDILLIVNSVH